MFSFYDDYILYFWRKHLVYMLHHKNIRPKVMSRRLTLAAIPPTNILFGMRVPNLGAFGATGEGDREPDPSALDVDCKKGQDY